MQLFINKDKNKNKIMYFFNTRLSMIFFFFEVKALTIVVLKILAFSTSKRYFIYFTISLYNTPNIKFLIEGTYIILIKYYIYTSLL